MAHLSRLPNLRVLWLSHNPCADHQYYRPYTVRKLQSLVKLDNAEVKKEERIAAARLNFETIFREHPSYVVASSPQGSSSSTRQSQYMSNGKLKRPTTPNTFQNGASGSAA